MIQIGTLLACCSMADAQTSPRRHRISTPELNDNDGHGPAAQMNWGGGLSPAWSPAGFGVVTLIE